MLRGREKILPKDHDPCGSGNKRELACGSGNNRGNTWRVTAEITEEICDSGNHMAGPDPHRGKHLPERETLPTRRLEHPPQNQVDRSTRSAGIFFPIRLMLSFPVFAISLSESAALYYFAQFN